MKKVTELNQDKKSMQATEKRKAEQEFIEKMAKAFIDERMELHFKNRRIEGKVKAEDEEVEKILKEIGHEKSLVLIRYMDQITQEFIEQNDMYYKAGFRDGRAFKRLMKKIVENVNI